MFYETCSALDDPSEPARKKQKTKNNNKPEPPKTAKPVGCADDNYCKACGNWGHKRRSSRLCPMNRKLCDSHPSVVQLEAMTEEEQQRTQQSLLDSIPLEVNNSSKDTVESILEEQINEDVD
ncbi:unknown protein [Seminavis robusta]|uniref:Zinc knuckle domain-containing protein n=1 Tax=Seminavis robusta TaxID=568900 RepID=A0A9N8EUR0_9STRA|nr:unknown protein [Seminavis robusta]|eukprot:Sro1937_g306460.1 n/a (122) ;mRNA; f:15689-16054